MKKVKIINYNINIKGSNVEGKDVTLDAKENLNVTASETTNKLEQNSKSSSASVGVGFDIVTGQVSSVTISGSKSKGEVSANSTSYNESTVKADKSLDFTSGKDTNIKGGKLSGEKVTSNVGGDLNIESKQDKNSYEEKNSSAGFGIGMPVGDKDSANKIGIFGSAGKSNVDSKYESVTDQSGIYTGKEGFDINVEGNTDIKGGIISSEAEKDKNKISTGTLTYEDIQNKADYKAGSIGINVDTSKNAKKKDAGVTPNIGVGAKDDAESTTKATVSEGEIEIRDKENQKQDLDGLNRDTKNSLNKLGEIFDKTKVEERQELAGLFGEMAYKAVGDLSIKNGWKEGSAEKNALHAFVGGIMSELTNSGFLAGASGAMINEMIQDKLSDMFKDDPAMHQWASALIGGVVSQVVADNAQAGAGTASSGTKNNVLNHEQEDKHDEEVSEAANDRNSSGKIKDKHEYWAKVDKEQQEQLINKLNDPAFVERLDAALKENPDITEFEGVVIKGKDLYGNVIDATNLQNREDIINKTNPTISSIMNGLSDVAVSEILGVAEDSTVVRDMANKYQWAVYGKNGIKYIRKVPLASGVVLVFDLYENSKNMSNEELLRYAEKEGIKFTVGAVGGSLTGAIVGTTGGPAGTVIGGIAGAFVGAGFETVAEMGMDRLQRLVGDAKND